MIDDGERMIKQVVQVIRLVPVSLSLSLSSLVTVDHYQPTIMNGIRYEKMSNHH